MQAQSSAETMREWYSMTEKNKVVFLNEKNQFSVTDTSQWEGSVKRL